MMASLEAKIPTRDRASVRVCESMLETQLASSQEALSFVNASLSELETSADPNGMKLALQEALIGLGDAIVLSDSGAYEQAAMNFATVCTDIVSGEYGK